MVLQVLDDTTSVALETGKLHNRTDGCVELKQSWHSRWIFLCKKMLILLRWREWFKEKINVKDHLYPAIKCNNTITTLLAEH